MRESIPMPMLKLGRHGANEESCRFMGLRILRVDECISIRRDWQPSSLEGGMGSELWRATEGKDVDLPIRVHVRHERDPLAVRRKVAWYSLNEHRQARSPSPGRLHQRPSDVVVTNGSPARRRRSLRRDGGTRPRGLRRRTRAAISECSGLLPAAARST
jgi:hypothetical protein